MLEFLLELVWLGFSDWECIWEQVFVSERACAWRYVFVYLSEKKRAGLWVCEDNMWVFACVCVCVCVCVREREREREREWERKRNSEKKMVSIWGKNESIDLNPANPIIPAPESGTNVAEKNPADQVFDRRHLGEKNELK